MFIHEQKIFFEISSKDELRQVASAICKKLNKTKLLLLYGDLGVGKTALCQELIYEITGETDVQSPTFCIVNSYEGNGSSIFHYDLYRVKSAEELFELPLQDDINNGIVLIEWPEIALGILERYEYTKVNILTRGDIRLITID